MSRDYRLLVAIFSLSRLKVPTFLTAACAALLILSGCQVYETPGGPVVVSAPVNVSVYGAPAGYYYHSNPVYVYRGRTCYYSNGRRYYYSGRHYNRYYGYNRYYHRNMYYYR